MPEEGPSIVSWKDSPCYLISFWGEAGAEAGNEAPAARDAKPLHRSPGQRTHWATSMAQCAGTRDSKWPSTVASLVKEDYVDFWDLAAPRVRGETKSTCLPLPVSRWIKAEQRSPAGNGLPARTESGQSFSLSCLYLCFAQAELPKQQEQLHGL